MTESPFVKTEGPEPPDVADILSKRHQPVLSKVDDAILDQLTKQSMLRVSGTTGTIFIEDTRNQYGYAYYREQMQPDRPEIERVRAEVYRAELELARQRNKLTQATGELNRVSDSLRLAVDKLTRNYELIGQLVGYLDSIEWGTHDEWTRSQSLREQAHEYVGHANNTIAT